MADFYPSADSQLPPFHTTFKTECTNYAAVLASVLTAGILSEIVDHTAEVIILINAADEAKNYASEVIAWKEICLRAPKGTPLPAPPTAPVIPALPVKAIAGIEAWTRDLVSQIKAHPNYTTAIGQAMGIIAPVSAPGTPAAVAVALTASQVQLNLSKAGYSVLAVDSRINGGAWTQLVVATNSPYIDGRAPLVAGVPEYREYRVQGIENNVRVGAISAVTSVWTVP